MKRSKAVFQSRPFGKYVESGIGRDVTYSYHSQLIKAFHIYFYTLSTKVHEFNVHGTVHR